MELAALLEKKKETILNEWFEQVIHTYAPDSASFYQNQKDAFANPVGSTTKQSLARLFTLLINSNDPDAAQQESPADVIDPLVRIRAVQNFTPSRAVGFVFLLKPIIRNHYKRHRKKIALEALLDLESRIDMLALTGFDVFMGCREKIYSLKTNTERDKIYKAFARAGLIKEVAADEPNPKFV